MRSSATPYSDNRSVTAAVICPFDSWAIAPIEYRHPNAVGASVPPKITSALSLIATATYDSGFPVCFAIALEQPRNTEKKEGKKTSY